MSLAKFFEDVEAVKSLNCPKKEKDKKISDLVVQQLKVLRPEPQTIEKFIDIDADLFLVVLRFVYHKRKKTLLKKAGFHRFWIDAYLKQMEEELKAEEEYAERMMEIDTEEEVARSCWWY